MDRYYYLKRPLLMCFFFLNSSYFGRKRLQTSFEPWVTHYIVKAGYSYWTLGYVLTLKGAKKLLAADPLKNMVPVDEYLPILFDQHPR